MARITVEDCPIGRFELVAIAAFRAKIINSGGEITVERENDKATVIALREIAEGFIKPEVLKEELIRNFQTTTRIVQPQEQPLDLDQEETDDFDYLPDSTGLYVDKELSLEDEQILDDNNISDIKREEF